MDISEVTTRESKQKGNLRVVTEVNRPTDVGPSGLRTGDFIFNDTAKSLDIYDGTNWRGHKLTTTSTSTSTSTTTSTSTSTS